MFWIGPSHDQVGDRGKSSLTQMRDLHQILIFLTAFGLSAVSHEILGLAHVKCRLLAIVASKKKKEKADGTWQRDR